jgi:ribosomal protein S18 acetylase RimI-like enzyme
MLPIRPLHKGDRDTIQRILTRSTSFDQMEIATAEESVNMALDHRGNGEYSIYCAHMPQGDPLGFICFGHIPTTDRCYDLHWIVVDKKFTGRGVGGELLLFMEESLVKKNGRRIYIEISSAPKYNPIRHFYENRGFFVDSVLDDFYRDGEDKFIYRKDL